MKGRPSGEMSESSRVPGNTGGLDGSNGGGEGGRETWRLLIVGSPDWHRVALQAVLEPAGFEVMTADDPASVPGRVLRLRPDAVLLNGELGGGTSPTVCRKLVDDLLPPNVPVIAFSTGAVAESRLVEMLHAGAWQVLREPVHSRLLVASVRRLLGLARLIPARAGGRGRSLSSADLSIRCLAETLPTMGALAARSETSLSCVAVGPTARLTAGDDAEKRVHPADLATRNIRDSDMCGLLDGDDLAIIAFGATADGAGALVERLNALAADHATQPERVPALSAGIVEMRTGSEPKPPRREMEAKRVAGLETLARAHDALREAREAGGGVQVTRNDP